MAAIGLAVVEQFFERVSRRRAMAGKWIAALHDTPVRIFNENVNCAPWQVFPVLLPESEMVEDFVREMSLEGIEIRRYYTPSLGECRGMTHWETCPNAKDLAGRAVALPMRSWMPDADQSDMMARTVAVLRSVCEAV